MTRLRFGPIVNAFAAPVPDQPPTVAPPPGERRDLSITIDRVDAETYPARITFRPEPYRGREAEVHELTRIHVVTFPAGTFPPASPEAALAAAVNKYVVDVSANVDGEPVVVDLDGLAGGVVVQGLTILEDEV